MTSASNPLLTPSYDDPEVDELRTLRLVRPYDFNYQGLTLDDLVVDELAALRAKKKLQDLQVAEVMRRTEMVFITHNNADEQAAEMLLCKNDVTYFINNYVYTFDPREEAQYVPFLLFDFQRELAEWAVSLVMSTIKGVGRRTGLIEKSRDMGVSWVMIAVAVWFWLFHGGSIHIGSRVFDEADMLGDPGSMLEKVRIILRYLPDWMLPPGFDKYKEKEFMKLGNIGMPGWGTITCEAASKNFARSDRKTFVLIDELAFWEYADDAMRAVLGGSANAVFVISTPNGPYNRFARMANPEEGEPIAVEKKTYYWTLHPVKRAGARLLPNGCWTSHWWREATKPPMEPEDVASEIEIKYTKSARGIIFQEYGADHQVQDWDIDPRETGFVYRIQDPGVHWFVLWMFVDKYGRVIFLQETYHPEAYVDDVGWDIKRKSAKYKGRDFEDCGDPNGAIRQVGSAKMSDYDVLEKDHGIRVDTSLFDDVPSDEKVTARISQLHNFLGRRCPKTGTPMMLVDTKNCPILHRALSGGYRRKVDPKTKKVLDAIHNEHPEGDSIDCAGMGVIQVFGMPGEYKNKNKPVIPENGKIFEWRGQKGYSRGMR